MRSRAFLRKALERVSVAERCISEGFVTSTASNLYFAFFNYFQSVVGNPPKGKWRHVSIAKAFVHKAYRDMSLPVGTIKKLKEAYEDLYKYRLRADYSEEELSSSLKPLLEGYIFLLRSVLNEAES